MSLKKILKELSLNNKTIINVDIQSEYQSSISFLREWTGFINDNYIDNEIVFLYNGESLGMTNEQEYQMWLWENGIKERVLDTSTFFDKGYGFFRSCMDNGREEEFIVDLVEFMWDNNIRDTRDIDKQMWKEYIEYKDDFNQDMIDILKDHMEVLYIPELMDYLNRSIRGNIQLTGGGTYECLREVEIALQALNKNYNIIEQYTY